MKASSLAVAVAVLAFSAFASAQTTVYTNLAAFQANLAPGSYTETFADSGFSGDPSASFSGGGYGYTISAPGGLYGNGTFLGTNLPNEALTVSFTGAPVTALGGNFYATNFSDAFQAVPVTLSLSDGTTTTFTPSSVIGSFRGFTSAVAITSLTVGAPGASLYVGMDNFTVGSVVPEPGTWLMMALGIGALVLRQSRASARA
ncbi:MAG: PEP-CTERM sorting domain-containing protein [Rubrivivax sp.]|nr:PEP-CTERM sorting domain-containing protein [Rubrivivax sp.]MDP3610546.1 PEP-CTERM sorting domain-containing protein [Rubrivivax sp.]